MAEPTDPRGSAHARWQGEYDRAGSPRERQARPFGNLAGRGRAPGAGGLYGLGESPNSKYFRDILSDFKPGEEPLHAGGRGNSSASTASRAAVGPSLNCLPDGVPHADLLPEPFKIIQTPGEILMLYEVETIFRQIFTDGRKHPADPSPAWLGYSVGKWEGDTLVVDTMGFNDLSWLDARGHGHSEDMRVEERFHRRDFGHHGGRRDDYRSEDLHQAGHDQLRRGRFFRTPMLFEHICFENEKDAAHHAGQSG